MDLFRWIKPVADTGATRKQASPLTRSQTAAVAFVLLLSAVLLSGLLGRQSHFSAPVYKAGDIARADIVIPADALIEDEKATEVRRAEAAARALPVYRFNPSLPEEQVARLKGVFGRCRTLLGIEPAGKESGSRRVRPFKTLPASVKADLRANIQDLGIKSPSDGLLAFLVQENFKPAQEEQLALLLKEAYAGQLIADDARFTQGRDYFFRVNRTTGKPETVPVGLLTTLSQARGRIDRQIGLDSRLTAENHRQILGILENMILPNLTFDEALTRARQEEDVRNVDHVLRKLKKGKVIVRQGDEISEDQRVQIEAIRKLSPAGFSAMQTGGMALLIAILLAFFAHFIRFIRLNQWSYLRLAAFLLLALAVNLLLLKAAWFVYESVSQSFLASPFNDRTFYFYLLPFSCGSMLVAQLAGQRCAQLFIVFFLVLAWQATGTDPSGAFYVLLANLAGVIFVRRPSQRLGIVLAGFKLGLWAAFLSFLLGATGTAVPDPTAGSFGAALAFLSGPLNAIILIFTLPLCERLFMVATEIRLSELGNLNLPLIRELILKAPGTYNHSIAVGTLGEGAAAAIGVNPLFLRIAGLYHDIGKTVQPEYFVENQKEGNPHDRLPPEESVRILKNHVQQGIALARAAHLPAAIVDMIPQHHGTKLMRFFFEKARQAAPADGDLPEAPYRYAGPKPRTKAAAILMLADGIEAAARTIEGHSREKLHDLIRRIATDAAQDGQFSECDITLAEMSLITDSFLETLSNYYHGRITYPGFDFNHPGAGPAEDGLLPR